MEIIKNQYNSGKLVKEVRKMSNLKQEELGKQISRCRESIARVENNKQEMTLSKFLETLKINNLNIVIFKNDDNA